MKRTRLEAQLKTVTAVQHSAVCISACTDMKNLIQCSATSTSFNVQYRILVQVVGYSIHTRFQCLAVSCGVVESRLFVVQGKPYGVLGSLDSKLSRVKYSTGPTLVYTGVHCAYGSVRTRQLVFFRFPPPFRTPLHLPTSALSSPPP